MLIAMMFLVVAMKSRTFSSFPYLDHGQVDRSWEGAQPDREPSWPIEIFHTIDITLHLRMGVGMGAGIPFFFSLSLFLFSRKLNNLMSVSSNFSRSLVFFVSFPKFAMSMSSRLQLRDWLWIRRQVIVLYTFYFA